MLPPRLQELQSLAQELLRALGPGWAEELLRRGLEQQRGMELRLLRAQGQAGDLLAALGVTESSVAQHLLSLEAELRRSRRRLQALDSELQRAQEAETSAQAHTQELQRELSELRERLERLEQDREHEEEAVPAAAYVTQLYYKISRIDWDYEAEPGQIKGIHYGPEVARPLDLDGAQHSQGFVSDFLWSLVPTEW